jgi:hypothetical protein
VAKKVAIEKDGVPAPAHTPAPLAIIRDDEWII